MKIKKSQLIKLIREQLVLEMPTAFDPYQSTLDRRKYQNQLKQGEYILKYPSQREIDHEMMRINTLLVPRPKQYRLRLTKITNPQKMYNAYISILAWLKKNDDDKKTYRKMFEKEKVMDQIRYYLRKNGYEHMLVGKGGSSPITLH